jgi:2-succinyl-5-enolpyruvyl-6-hydroxy-3-cyclohexene-1-carboxylate synthase
MHKISHWVGPADKIFLGNSLPIRYWDRFGVSQGQEFGSQRGANGIDGLVSHFLGFAGPTKSWLILGDLSAMYDLSALAATHHAQTQDLKVVVINNQGGQIFTRIFSDPAFTHPHNINFKGWAEQFSWEYICLEKPPVDMEFPPGPTIIEVKPENQASTQFWTEFESL